MNQSLDWAAAIAVINQLTLEIPQAEAVPDPSGQLQDFTGNTLSSLGPTEFYSERIPTLPSDLAQTDLRPIDILYGTYDPVSRKIEVFFKSIDLDKSIYGASFQDLLQIVRLHEYAHALVHLGIRAERTESVLFSVNDEGNTDWEAFLSNRLTCFSQIDPSSHEFLAQALAYSAILRLPNWRRDRLCEIFHRLEAYQPVHYRLPSAVLSYLEGARWDVVLDAARGEIQTLREANFSLCEGLQELVCFTAGKHPEKEDEPREWLVQVDGNITETLKNALVTDDSLGRAADENERFLVDKYGALKIEVFAREHPPPHFRVICGSESANYRIEDCYQLNGGLRAHYRAIRRWHTDNKTKLIDVWNERRPTDCPVGAYRGAI